MSILQVACAALEIVLAAHGPPGHILPSPALLAGLESVTVEFGPT